MLETALNEEMTEHLGHEKHRAPDVRDITNVRNGTRPKTVLTEATGQVEIEVPWDRDRRGAAGLWAVEWTKWSRWAPGREQGGASSESSGDREEDKAMVKPPLLGTPVELGATDAVTVRAYSTRSAIAGRCFRLVEFSDRLASTWRTCVRRLARARSRQSSISRGARRLYLEWLVGQCK